MKLPLSYIGYQQITIIISYLQDLVMSSSNPLQFPYKRGRSGFWNRERNNLEHWNLKRNKILFENKLPKSKGRVHRDTWLTKNNVMGGGCSVGNKSDKQTLDCTCFLLVKGEMPYWMCYLDLFRCQYPSCCGHSLSPSIQTRVLLCELTDDAHI